MHKTLVRLAALQKFKPIQIKGKSYLTDEDISNTDFIYTGKLNNHSAWIFFEGYLTWGAAILIPICTDKEIAEAILSFLPVTPLGSDTDEEVDEVVYIIKTAPSHVIDEYISWVKRFKDFPCIQETLNFFYTTAFSKIPSHPHTAM